LLKGVLFLGEGVRTSSMILTLDDRQVRFIDSVHLEKRPDIKVRFNGILKSVRGAFRSAGIPERASRARQSVRRGFAPGHFPKYFAAKHAELPRYTSDQSRGRAARRSMVAAPRPHITGSHILGMKMLPESSKAAAAMISS